MTEQITVWERKNWGVGDLIAADRSASPTAARRVEVVFDWENSPVIDVDMRMQADHMQPMERWHCRQRAITISDVDAAALDETLASDEVAALVRRVIGGYECVWDGNNRVGEYTDDAEAAWAEIEAIVEALDGSLSEYEFAGVWDVEEWIGSDSEPVQSIMGATTDAEIAAIAARVIDDAACDYVVLAGDVEDYLRGVRDELVAID